MLCHRRCQRPPNASTCGRVPRPPRRQPHPRSRGSHPFRRHACRHLHQPRSRQRWPSVVTSTAHMQQTLCRKSPLTSPSAPRYSNYARRSTFTRPSLKSSSRSTDRATAVKDLQVYRITAATDLKTIAAVVIHERIRILAYLIHVLDSGTSEGPYYLPRIMFTSAVTSAMVTLVSVLTSAAL